VRIGSVPYLNARPLVDALERDPRPGISLSYATPAVLIARLLAGELDIAMASTFAALEHPELVLLREMGVTNTGAAWSVRLISRVPLAEARTLALDASSRSSVAMARIILADRYSVFPTCISAPPDLDAMLARADAAVLIGDIGLAIQPRGVLDVDLGAEWYALTGLPFFFAGWMARDAALLEEAAPVLRASLAHGLARLEGIAAEEAARLHLPADRCYAYLHDVMQYHAGEAEWAGLEAFRMRATRLGLLP
jgi:chorismate dehydratase